MRQVYRLLIFLLVFTIHQTSVFANNVCEEILLAGADTQETLIERVVQAYEKLLSQTTASQNLSNSEIEKMLAHNKLFEFEPSSNPVLPDLQTGLKALKDFIGKNIPDQALVHSKLKDVLRKVLEERP